MFTLIDLPYSQSALEPVISAQTLSFHHGKHLQAYVDNLNKLIAGTEFESMSLEEIVIASSKPVPEPVEGPARKAIFNNAGQILNHNLYFTQFTAPERFVMPPMPKGKGGPVILPRLPKPRNLSKDSALGKQVIEQWGTIDAFKEEFVAKGVGLFGSGWVWLSAAPDGSLVITQEPGASNPICRTVPELAEGPAARLRPILTFDVWEHAYYLDYQNRRAAHLEALWKIVDWKVVESRYLKQE